MPTPKPGEVWLVRFPFTDLTTTKQRPAFVVATHGEDIIVAGIFSRVPAKLRATWILIDEWIWTDRTQEDFNTQGREACRYPRVGLPKEIGETAG